MSLESATYISSLASSNPLGSDLKAQGDDHLRLVKAVLQATFPNADKPVRFPTSVAAKTGTYTVVSPDDQNALIPVDASGGDRLVNLPAMTGVAAGGFAVIIVKSDTTANLVTIDGNGADTINGATTLVLRRAFQSAIVIWNNATSSWFAIVDSLSYSPALSKTTTYTVALADDGVLIVADATSAAFTITLPSSGIPNGFKVTIVKADASTNAITASCAAGINGASTKAIRQRYETHTFWWNGTQWYFPLPLDGIDVGMIMQWAKSTPPANGKWLELNGAAISRTTYADLFTLWGTDFGTGDGSSTFNLMDMRGEFPRGWDHGKGSDPDAATRTSRGDGTTGDVIGSKQADALKTHTHSYNTNSSLQNLQAGGNTAMVSPTSQTTGNPSTGTAAETRPRNVNLMYIVKALI